MKNLIFMIIFSSFCFESQSQKVQKLLKAGNVDEAVVYCEKRQGKGDCYNAIGDYHFYRKDLETAEKYYLKSDNTNYGIKKLGDRHLKNGDISYAEEYYLKLDNPDYNIEKLAKYCLENDDPENAEKYYGMISKQPQVFADVADGYLRVRNYEKAEECYAKAGFMEIGNYRIADALFVDKKFNESVEYYNKVGKSCTVAELDSMYNEIIEPTQVFGLVGLSSYTNEKKISIFNLRIANEKSIVISYALPEEVDATFLAVVSYINEEGNIAYEPHAPTHMSRYYHHYVMSPTTITLSLSDRAKAGTNHKVYVIDASSGNSKAVSNTIVF